MLIRKLMDVKFSFLTNGTSSLIATALLRRHQERD